MFSFLSKPSGMDISISEFKEKVESNPGVIIDVRTRQEYDQGHLKMTDAQYDWNGGEFQDAIEDLDKDKTYYLYCRSGNRSGQAARMMKNEGFENVYNIGGFDDLASNGFESE
ncbi:MAG: rhodanese-like domain-containing protein [Balneolaceae bacterium]|nr:MAG: rhodanese-like domain-containing protein [Balneolaceae bacterium]